MTSVADARVLPEPLSESAAKLRASWAPLDAPHDVLKSSSIDELPG